MSEIRRVKVLITGASGLLGRAVYKYFSNEETRIKYPLSSSAHEQLSTIKFDCVGLCYSTVDPHLKQLDLCNFHLVREFIQDLQPDVIIHCAAEKKAERVDADFEKAAKLNSGATENLASISAESGIFFIYISSCNVFDGKNPPYKIDDQPNPVNKYALTKLRGEQATKNSSDKHCIVRLPILYGSTEPNKIAESSFYHLIEKVKKCEPFLIDSVLIKFPTHVVDVSRFLMQLTLCYLENSSINEQIKGIFHCSAHESYTIYEMSCIIAKVLNLPKEHIGAHVRELKGDQMKPMNPQLDTQFSFQRLDFFRPIMKFEETIKEGLENFI